MLASVQTGTLLGIEALPVTVEVEEGPGLPALELVGLPAGCVRESKVRVRAALAASGFPLPHRRYLVNLAPGDVRKNGTSFDLAIAAALLAVMGVGDAARLSDTLVIGELSIGGMVLPVRGALAQLRSAAARGIQRAVLPRDNVAEARLANGMDVQLVEHLGDLATMLRDAAPLVRASEVPAPDVPDLFPTYPDFSDVRGQESARRAMEIAALGGHHILMMGPPGAGKSMLAERFVTILPDLDADTALDVATIHGAVAAESAGGSIQRPFRAPHHSASVAAMVGGGDPVMPGEISLAHGGVLFLDELPEFRRDAIEGLRTTLEQGTVSVARARYRVTLPARAQVVAAMNPCPCGYAGDAKRVCRCPPDHVARYLSRVSGPLMDRFDLQLAIPRPAAKELAATDQGESSEAIRARIKRALAFRKDRRDGKASRTHGAAIAFLVKAMDQLGMSARAYHKVLRVARTIADLASANEVGKEHVAEALQYRRFDRPGRRLPNG